MITKEELSVIYKLLDTKTEFEMEMELESKHDTEYEFLTYNPYPNVDPVAYGLYGGARILRSGRRLPPSKEWQELKDMYTDMYFGRVTHTDPPPTASYHGHVISGEKRDRLKEILYKGGFYSHAE